MFAAVFRLICEVNLTDWAKPAASSSGETILEPEDSRANDFVSAELDRVSKRAGFYADMLVLMTIRQLLLSCSCYCFVLYGFHAGKTLIQAFSMILCDNKAYRGQ